MISVPRVLTLRKPAVKVSKGTATVTLSGAAQLPTGVATTLRLYRGKSAAGLSPSVTLSRTGRGFRGTLRIKQTSKPQVVYVQARATLSAGTTTCTPTFGVPCVSATRSAAIVRSSTVRIVIPAKQT